MNLIEYVKERLSRPDSGNNKGYRGHTIVIQETFFNSTLNIKRFCDLVNNFDFVDLSNKVNGIPSSKSYEFICEQISSGVNLTLLKNLTPTAHRMGLIDLLKNGRENISFTLSNLGKKIVDIDNLPQDEQIWKLFQLSNEASKNLFDFYKSEKGFDLIETMLILLNDSEFTSLDFNEFFILLDDIIDIDTKRDLIFEYRKMTNTRMKKIRYENFIYDIFIQNNDDNKSKLEKRDFGNVKNQISRVMEKLNLMVLFTYDRQRSIITMKENYGTTFNGRYRSGIDIREAKYKHSILIGGLDGHHIVPHDFIVTPFGKDRKLIENWKNIIFIDKETHSKFPNKKNPYLLLSENENEIVFTSIFDVNDYIKIEKTKFNGNLNFVKDMLNHNSQIIKYLTDVKVI